MRVRKTIINLIKCECTVPEFIRLRAIILFPEMFQNRISAGSELEASAVLGEERQR